jgi:4-alpha-glucanotransferase
MSDPLRFAFGLHLHQPVGNFDWVFERHLAQVYRPLLHEVIGGGCAPATLHLSGPLLDWLELHNAGFLDELGRLVADGRLELLLAGYDEPILIALPREDRLEQIARMREALRARFGIEAAGLWLTERVWEPDLAADLHDAGVRYALVDDRHFLVAGFDRDALHRPWRTEHGGRGIELFPIDEQLRYLVPFRPPAELAEYLRQLRQAGHGLAVLADDGEKFGGWPGTFEWVYQKGWLRDFLAVLDELRENGEIRLVTLSQALAEVPAQGPAYLPTASYREMEAWSLPADGARRLAALEAELGEARIQGPDGSLVRGSHWRNFLAKYPEANRMHKKMLALSALCREHGDPPRARRAVGRAQCNDAYWHGVFGGLYLPHLREALWRELAIAESELRRGEPLAWEERDLDHDGAPELWVHSAAGSALLSPRRGAGIEELTHFGTLTNYAATLTRRREAYHKVSPSDVPVSPAADLPTDSAPSIHELEKSTELSELPPLDQETRGLFQERIWPGSITVAELAGGALPLHSWALAPARWEQRNEADALIFRCELDGLVKTLRFHPDGGVEVTFAWERQPDWPEDCWFSTELSLARPLELDASRAVQWRYPIETVAKSEQGLERTLQGESVTLAWPVTSNAARVTLDFAS